MSIYICGIDILKLEKIRSEIGKNRKLGNRQPETQGTVMPIAEKKIFALWMLLQEMTD